MTAPFLALLIVPLMGMVAFAIDYGYLTVVRSDLQRTADAAALAAVVDLIPNQYNQQNTSAARARVRQYVADNLGVADDDMTTQFAVADKDIQIGRYDPTTIYSGNITLLPSGIADTVRVTLRRDASLNSPVKLFFARVLGITSNPMQVTSTAVLRQAIGVKAKGDVLPFAIQQQTWDNLPTQANFSIYSNNQVYDANGNLVAGNWGTVDLGYLNNSTSDLNGQIIQGLRQTDVNQLYIEGRIPNSTMLPVPLTVQAETGMSSGMKSAVQSIYGETRMIPIYDTVNGDFGGGGNTAEFHVVKWGVIKVVTSNWNGQNDTYITAIKSWTYDGALVPLQDLSNKNAPFENAFTSPVLVE